MISNPGLPRIEPAQQPAGPRLFSHWQLLSLVPSIVSRLQTGARVLQLEVSGGAMLGSLARAYPNSHFIGLTTGSAMRMDGPVKFAAMNLHFKRVETFDLTRYRDVDLVLALAGLDEDVAVRAIRCMTPGACFVVREPEPSIPTESTIDNRINRLHPLIPGRAPSRRPTIKGRATHLLEMLFAEVLAVRLPEDPGFVYYVARAG